ncbi:MAG: DNA primase [Gallionella sp.]|nr:DNA primase [Gallionella sp.]MDD4960356.1 DNA primase [Gallionella sp.]
MIPKSFIQDLLNRVDIVDVIERYVPLKKAGANFVACCPFHNEKSPSFTVSQTRQFYHCFGCGAHGTAIGFVMEHAGMGYVDAIETLASNAGITVPHERSTTEVQRVSPDLYEVMKTATRYYRQQLKASPRAIDYLKQRELTGEIAARFGLGYAPDDWQSLAAAFPNYQDNTLTEVGLVISNEEGKRYDRFRDRIMFPIVNVRGQVIGFGGRVLDKGEPKYLNSPETPLFEKGRELYGLFQAQKAIRDRQQVLVVEGYMDVVALAQHGVDYAVATLGTATTPHHIQKLLRFTPHIIFCFDGDRAGQKAAWRALENALPHLQDGKSLSFLFLPEEHDPDSYIRAYGQEGFENKLDDALPLSTYLLRQISFELNLRTSEGRNQLLQRAKPLLAAITAPTTALLLRKEVAALAGISQGELEALYEITPVARPTRPAFQKASRTTPSAHRLLLQCLIAQPALGAQLPADWHEDGAEAEAVAAVLAVLREANFKLSNAVLIQTFQGTRHEKPLTLAQADLLNWGEGFDIQAEFTGLLNQLATHQRRHRFEQLQERVAQVGMANLSDAERRAYLKLLQRG